MKKIYNCNCGLCSFISTYEGTSGGWADPRKHYSESEKDFLIRVPDGFIKWPNDHLDVLNKNENIFNNLNLIKGEK